jgi:hypothetical protein
MGGRWIEHAWRGRAGCGTVVSAGFYKIRGVRADKGWFWCYGPRYLNAHHILYTRMRMMELADGDYWPGERGGGVNDLSSCQIAHRLCRSHTMILAGGPGLHPLTSLKCACLPPTPLPTWPIYNYELEYYWFGLVDVFYSRSTMCYDKAFNIVQ